MIPLLPRNPAGKTNIAYWENFLSDDDINKLLGLPQWHILESAKIGLSNTDQSTIDKDVRNSQVSWLSYSPETHDLWVKITSVIDEVNRRFFHFDLIGCCEPAQLTLYKSDTENHYNWHCDASVEDRNVPRKLSMSLLLSHTNEFKGGDLQIKEISDDPVTLEQKRGRAWFFPSYVLHRVTPVTAGIRRSLVLWIGGPAFK